MLLFVFIFSFHIVFCAWPLNHSPPKGSQVSLWTLWSQFTNQLNREMNREDHSIPTVHVWMVKEWFSIEAASYGPMITSLFLLTKYNTCHMFYNRAATFDQWLLIDLCVSSIILVKGKQRESNTRGLRPWLWKDGCCNTMNFIHKCTNKTCNRINMSCRLDLQHLKPLSISMPFGLHNLQWPWFIFQVRPKISAVNKVQTTTINNQVHWWKFGN